MAMFQLENREALTVIIPSADVRNQPETTLHREAEPVFSSLRTMRARAVIVDLAQVPFFGSAFISVLVRMHKIVRQGGGEVVLAGAGDRAREVLHLTGLNKLWTTFAARADALAVLTETEPAEVLPASSSQA